jgi:MFS family permease
VVLTHRLTRLWRDRPIVALMIAELLVWAGFFYAFVALPLDIAATTGWSLSQIMGAFSVALICLAFSTPLAGRCIDHGLGPVCVPLAAVGGALALIGVAAAPGLPLFYLLWAGIGFAMGFTLYEPVFALIARARGDAARGGITAIAVAAGAASLLSFPTAHLVSRWFGWPVALVVFAVLILLVAAPCMRFATRRLEAEAAATRNAAAVAQHSARQGTSRHLYQDRRFRALVLVFVLPALCTGLVLSHVLPIMAELRVPPALAVLAAALIGPVQIAARLLAQGFAAGRPARDIVLFGFLCLVIGAAALFAAGWATAALVLFVLAFGAGNGLVGIFRPLVVRDALGTGQIGATTGAIAMPALLALAVAPILGARILETADVGALLIIAGACPLLAFMALANLPADAGHSPD